MSVHGTGALDRSDPVPLYYQVKQWISARITSGELAPGSRLPNEVNLCDAFGVSRGVVRQAMAELTYAGVITRQRGRGTFVSEPKTAEGLIGGLIGLADDAAARGQRPDSEVLVLRQAPASDAVAVILGLEPGEPVVELERLRRLAGEPHVLVMTYLPARLVPGLVSQDLTGPASLYGLLRQHYQLAVRSGVRRVEAAVAGTREARLLRIRRGDPLLVLRSLGYGQDRSPLEHFVAYHRGDRSAFETRLTAAPGAPPGPSPFGAYGGSPPGPTPA